MAADPNLPTDRRLIPHPTTWLNRDGWDDEPYPPNHDGRGPSGSRMFADTAAVVPITRDDDPTEAVIQLAETFSGLLADLDVKHTVGKTWHRDLRLMIERDGRTPAEIEGAMRWALADPFWQPNIHSPRALRKQYDRLRLQATRTSAHNGRRPDPVQQGLDLAAHYRAQGE